MTNKINGIDVSECKHHYTNPVNGIIYHGCAIYEQINELGYSQDTLCEQNPDCYFKQLKHLQEELKKDMGNIEKIEKLVISPDGKVTKKYFLPIGWEKINKMSVNYHFWKMIAEGED